MDIIELINQLRSGLITLEALLSMVPELEWSDASDVDILLADFSNGLNSIDDVNLMWHDGLLTNWERDAILAAIPISA